ncbi:pilin [Actinacidiphila sp. bgisy167]|uniref:pilin n=1 Tax=Actinacidiphila sp. bgisy167 TaxID=3413797 RepID=UPI003D70DF8A
MPVRRCLSRPLVRHVLRAVAIGCCFALFVLVPACPAWAVATFPQVINNCRNWIMGIAGGTATLFLTVGGLRYVMAGGDPGEVEAAKRALRSAALGYGITAMAPIISAVVQSIVGAG